MSTKILTKLSSYILTSRLTVAYTKYPCINVVNCHTRSTKWKTMLNKKHGYCWLGPGLLCSNFYLLCFWAVLKKTPIMLNIIPIIISIMPQFKYKFYYFNELLYVAVTTLVYVVHFIRIYYIAACCNTNINEHGTFFEVESEAMVATVLLLPSN